MCGSTDDASKAAIAEQKAKEAQIAGAQANINAVYNDPARAKQIADFTDSVRTLNRQNLDKQKQGADRGAKFALARSGLTGGSAAIDTNADITRSYNKGLISAEQSAQAAGAGLTAADQEARLNLIQMANSGLDSTTGQTQALEGLRTSLAKAKQDALTNGVENVFGSLADTYKKSQEAKGRRDASKYGFNSLYGRDANAPSVYGPPGD